MGAGLENTYGLSDQGDDVTKLHLLFKAYLWCKFQLHAICGSLNFIPCVEKKIPEGVHPLPNLF